MSSDDEVGGSAVLEWRIRQLKVRVSTIIKLLLLAVVLIDLRLLYLKNINQLIGIFIAIIAVGLTSYQNAKKLRDNHAYVQMPFLRKTTYATVASFVAVYIFSLVKYGNQSMMRTLVGDSAHYKMIYIILLLPIAQISIEEGINWLLNKLNCIAAVLYILVALQFAIYNINGRVFLSAMTSGSELPLQDGTLRISLSWLGNLMILFNFYRFYSADSNFEKEHDRILHFVLFVLGFSDLIVISRIRGATLAITVALLVIAIACRNTKKELYKKMLLSFILVCGLFGTDIVSNFLGSFSLYGQRSYSTIARLYAMNFYWEAFLKNPLFGIGFADGSINFSIVHGDGRANVSDIGVFAQIAKYGIFILPVYILPLLNSLKRINTMRKLRCIADLPLYMGLAVYVVLSSVTLISIDQFRMLQWPIYLIIIEIAYWNTKQQILNK